MSDTVKCACASCQCQTSAATGTIKDGKLYCSQACAYECTETTCLCVHEKCDDESHDQTRDHRH